MIENVDVHLGKRVRWRRRALSMTQDDVARRVGVRFQQIHKYECGAAKMSAGMLWKLAAALDTDIQYFYAGLSEGSGVAALPVAMEERAF